MDAASAPFIRGITKSNTIRSGFNSFACSIASTPSAAYPHTSKYACSKADGRRHSEELRYYLIVGITFRASFQANTCNRLRTFPLDGKKTSSVIQRYTYIFTATNAPI